MISVKRISSANEAGSYYSEAGYYTKDGVALSSSWGGEAAESLGLAGQIVDIDEFKNILSGRVAGIQLGKSDGQGGIVHAPGHDFTYSAPKGVSIAALGGHDERLIDAHHEAVRVAMKELEKKVLTRRNGELVTSANLMYASFTHTLSRSNDPQLHTHNVVPNATLVDGEWYSLESKAMYEHKMFTGLVYRSTLAALTQKLGYQVKVTDRQKGLWDIADIPDNLRDGMSKRRKEIIESAESRDITSQRGMETTALMTRSSKTKIQPEELWKVWDREAKECGVNLESIVSQAVHRADERASEQLGADTLNHQDASATDDVRLAVHVLAANEAAFSHENVLEKAMKLSLGQGHSYEDLSDALDNLINQREVLARQFGLTTPEAIRTESYIVSAMLNTKGTVPPLATPDIVQGHIDAYEKTLSKNLGFKATLTKGQRAGIELITSTRDMIVGVQGQAGTGKTTLVNVVNSIAESQGYKIVGLAQSGSAAETLYKETGIQSYTLDSFLFRTKQQRESNGPSYAGSEIWLVDEASLANAGHFSDLIKEARRSGARLVFTGDTQQHEAIEWGKIFYLLQAHGLPTALMDDITRQANSPELLAAIKSYYAGNINATLDLLGENVRECSSPLHAAIEKYASLTQSERDDSVFIIPSLKMKREFDNEAHKLQIAEGRIQNKESTVNVLERTNLNYEEMKDTRFYSEAGAQCMEFHTDEYSSLGVKAGELYRIDKINVGKMNSVELVGVKDNEKITFPLSMIEGKSKAKFDLYKFGERNFSQGEVVTWTKTRKNLGLLNGDKLEVLGFNDSTISLKNQRTDKVVELQLNRFHNFDYAYSVTSQKSQGITTLNAFAVMDSKQRYLSTHRALLVNISRAKIHAELFVDDKASLLKTMAENNEGKTIATRHVSKESMDAYARHIKASEKDVSELVNADLKSSMENLSIKKGMFSHSDLKREALKWSLGRYSPQDIDLGIERFRATKELSLISADKGGNHTFAISTTIKNEASLVRHIKEGVNARRRILSETKVSSFINEYNINAADKGRDVVNNDHAKTLMTALTSRDEISFVAAFARDGTVEAFRTANELLQHYGVNARTFAVTGNSVDDIKRAKLKGGSIYHWLKQLDERMLSGKKTNNSKDVWIIEEASLMKPDELLKIARYARFTGARAVFIGHEMENGIAWGNSIELLKSQAVPVITSNYKAVNASSGISSAAENFRLGKVSEALNGLASMMHELNGGDSKERYQVIADTYLASSKEHRENIAIIAPDKRARESITSIIRAELKACGDIGDDVFQKKSESSVFLTTVEKSDARFHKEGTIIVFPNGARLLVSSVDKENNIVTLIDGAGSHHKVNGQELGNVEVLSVNEHGFSIGDKIVFTKSLAKELSLDGGDMRGIRSKSTGRIVGYEKDSKNITVELSNGRHVSFNEHHFSDFQHNYVTSTHSLKGGDKKNDAIILLESSKVHSITHENIHGLLSNVKNNVRIITDSKDKTLAILKDNPGFKKSALANKKIMVSHGDAKSKFDHELGLMMSKTAKNSMRLKEIISDKIDNIQKRFNIGIQREKTL